MSEPEIQVRPLTAGRWKDLVELFARRGAALPRRCWCMYYRRPGVGESAESNRRAMRSLVGGQIAPGLIAYADASPLGWVSLGPREGYEAIGRSRVMKPLDDRPVWSLVCFFVDASARGRGIAGTLLDGAVDYARSRGADVIEAYPIDKEGRSENEAVFVGTEAMFVHAGFQEVARRTPIRPVMRMELSSARA